MKKRNRMLAILLAFTMVLTFMPMLAFAEGEEADAEPQVTEEAAEEVEAVAEEEAVNVVEDQSAEEVELTYEAKEAAVPKSAVFHHVGSLWGWAGDNYIEDNGWGLGETTEDSETLPPNNSIDVTFSDNTVKTYEFISDDDNDAWGYYLDGKISNGETDFYYDHNVRFQEGKNTVPFYMMIEGEEYKVGTIEVTGVKAKVDKLVYTQADPLEAEITEWGYADYMGIGDNYMAQFEGDTVQVKAYSVEEFYDGESDTPTILYNPYEAIYKFKKQALEEGEEPFYGFFLEKLISGKEYAANPTLDVKFWDDQEESPWKAGSTHEIIATYEGFEANEKLVVKVKGNATPHKCVAGNVEKIVITEATCTNAGSYDEVTYCKECGKEMSRVRKTSKALAHSIHKIAAKAATCQETGVKAHYECQNCGGMFKDSKGKKATTVKALTVKTKKHSFKKKIQTEEYLKSEANCTKKATYYYACSMCDTKGTKTYTVGKPLGHDFVPGSITKATAKKDGKIASKCSRCSKTNKGVKISKASKIVVLNKKSIVYVGNGDEKDAIDIVVKSSKYPLGADEYTVTKSEPTYNFKKKTGSGTVTVTFTPECKYYSGSMTLTYKITKVPKVIN